MQTLILPGYSKTNKDWVDEIVNNLKIDGVIRPFYWMHWGDDSMHFDAQEKADLIVKHIKDDNINIIAKSIGTLIATKIVAVIPNQIKKVILCGIPKVDLNEADFEFIKTVCLNNKNKITIIQNISDPHGTFEDVKDLGKIVPKESSDHNYPYFEDFNRILS
jgi:pimeloyl-ACP methyl ester carboxylesterase